MSVVDLMGRASRIANPGAELVAVQLREVTVEDDHLVLVDERLLEAGLAVEGHVDGVGVVAQAAGEGLGHPLVVLDDQHPHERSPRRPAAATRRSRTALIR